MLLTKSHRRINWAAGLAGRGYGRLRPAIRPHRHSRLILLEPPGATAHAARGAHDHLPMACRTPRGNKTKYHTQGPRTAMHATYSHNAMGNGSAAALCAVNWPEGAHHCPGDGCQNELVRPCHGNREFQRHLRSAPLVPLVAPIAKFSDSPPPHPQHP